ncbi:MAG: hypothetical protein HFF49_06630 [Lawsonibacter sp.]|jgi:hypothetical protein|nr:hypothetical protein [Lawsonibacter sp.]
MDERGLWKLFCETGLPAAWLAVVGQRREEEARREEPVRTAFQPNVKQV